jgi:NDP-sugar pyrophosphorylase family protein
MQAVILAGGKGTRLRPYTTEIPKPLVPVGEHPIIEILLTQLRRSGVEKVTLAVNHLAHLIEAVLGDGRRFDLDLRYSMEDRVLSTVAPLRLVKDLPDDFLVVNGDILTDLDFGLLFQYHLEQGAKLTVATHRRTDRIDYGVFETDADGAVLSFQEKPEYRFNVSMGVYVFSKDLVDCIPKDSAFGFDDLVYTMLSERQRIQTFPFDGFWLDIGRLDDYERVNRNPEIIARLLEPPK